MLSPTRFVLVLCSILMVGAVAVVFLPRSPVGPTLPATLPAPPPSAVGMNPGPGSGTVVELATILPGDAVEDGSVDYTVEVQQAIDLAAGGTLRLPPFPILVSRRSGQTWCLRSTQGLVIEGSPASCLIETSGRVQILRFEGANGLRLRGFGLEGTGASGNGLAHGLLQITGGEDVYVEGLRIHGADADGIAIAAVQHVRVRGCEVEGSSKAGIYLAACEDAVVEDNLVRGGTGHYLPGGKPVGAGIQLSSCVHVVCRGNVIAGGVGVGILCNANQGAAAPQSNHLVGNLIHDVRNPRNPNVSGGIRLANGASEKRTFTRVAGNTIRHCGNFGVFLENHDGVQVVDNLIRESDRTGVVVSTLHGGELRRNTILESGAAGTGQDPGIYLLNGAADLWMEDNQIEGSATPGNAAPTLVDVSTGGGHSARPRVRWAEAPPGEGPWVQGDLIYNALPSRGSALGWVCVESGEPGRWRPFATVE